MQKREPARTGDEQDVITDWRKLYTHTRRAGVCARVKRGIRRRERRAGRREARADR